MVEPNELLDIKRNVLLEIETNSPLDYLEHIDKPEPAPGDAAPAVAPTWSASLAEVLAAFPMPTSAQLAANARRVDVAPVVDPVTGELVHTDRWLSCSDCGSWSSVGTCEEEHRFARQILCHREWCPSCGKKWSDAHKRRFARWLPKCRQWSTMGYWVVTFPPAMREAMRDPTELRRLHMRLTRAFKVLGYRAGLRRWHFFGDATKPGQNPPYHPHLNVLVEGGWLDRDQLDDIKLVLRDAIEAPEAVINYSFRQTPAAMVHTLKYVSRPTFNEVNWAPEIALALRGFRNQQAWGGPAGWAGSEQWDMTPAQLEAATTEEDDDVKKGTRVRELAALESGNCPCCDKPIKWGPVVRMSTIRPLIAEDYGGGYYRLGNANDRRRRPDPVASASAPAPGPDGDRS